MPAVLPDRRHLHRACEHRAEKLARPPYVDAEQAPQLGRLRAKPREEIILRAPARSTIS